MMHDFQRDVSHLERLAELWLRATRRRDGRVGVDLRSMRNLPRFPFREIIFEKHSLRIFGEREERDDRHTERTGHDRSDLLCCDDNHV